MLKRFLLFTFAMLLFISLMNITIYSQQLVYTPINSSFGGYYFNSQWMLSEAQAQNGFTAPQSQSAYSPYGNTLQSFTQSLQSQILGQLSQQITKNIFGESGLKEGQYQIGNYSISVTPGTNGVVITIFDSSTGGQSTIEVPYF